MHTFDKLDGKDATCIETGWATYKCSTCGYYYEEIIPTTGHSYENEQISTDGGSVTCSVCGTQEVSYTTPPTTSKSSGAATNTFNVTVDKTGVYEVYLDYSYVKQNETRQDVGAVINKTLFPDYYQTTAQMSDMVGFVQSFDWIENSCDIPLGYSTDKETGYNAHYFDVYMEGGVTTSLVFHTNYSTNDGYEVTLRGARLVLVTETDAYAVTNHDGRVHTDNLFGSNLGFNVNYISNSNNSTRTSDETSVTLSGGTYDISYLAAAHYSHTDNELKITLSKDGTEIELRSSGIYADDVSSYTGSVGKMLLSRNLWVYDQAAGKLTDAHEVELDAGEWQVTVYCTNETSYRGLIFGGLFFAKI